MKRFILAAALLCCAFPALAGETGCIYDMKGTVETKKAGAAEWLPAAKGRPLAEGESVRTGSDAWCEILFRDGTYVRMDPGAETAAEELKSSAQERTFSFSFLRGRALWMAGKVAAAMRSKFQVRTPSAVCAVRGTSFAVDVSSAGETTLGLFEGKVALSAGSEEKDMLAGSEGRTAGGTLAVEGRLSRLMKAEERRYAKVKGRVDSLRKRLAERGDFIDDYIARQQKALSDFESRRREKLGKKK